MTANELRIGNLIVYNNKIKSIVEIYPNHVRVDGWVVNCDKIQPIQLTEEWLLKFGFDCRDSNVSRHWHIGINDVTHDWLFDIKWIESEEYPFYRNGKFKVKSVHQLQNLYFALTGEELKLKD